MLEHFHRGQQNRDEHESIYQVCIVDIPDQSSDLSATTLQQASINSGREEAPQKMNFIENSETLVRRVRKLGDYHAAASSMMAALMDQAVFKKRANIRFTEVSLGFSSSILAP